MTIDKSFAEFFAGIGLIHAGLQETGWNCVYANDMDEKKFEMYQHLFGNSSHYHVEDIWNTKAVLSRINKKLTLATASFPCVDLSLAGNRQGLSAERSGTFYGFIEILKSLKARNEEPPILLIENVMGFLTVNKGQDFKDACNSLALLGYWIDTFMVDAKHFIPQSRQRLFIVACKKEALPCNAYIRKPSCILSEWYQVVSYQYEIRTKKLLETLYSLDLPTGLFCLPIPNLPKVKTNIKDIIDVNNGDWWDENKVDKHLNEMSDTHRKLIYDMSKGKNLHTGTMYRRVRQGKSRTEIRSDGLAGCLRTPRGGSSKQMVYVSGKGQIKMRWMLPKEYASLQGMPDFPLKVGTTQALFGFGDAVCVPVIEWISSYYLNPIFDSFFNIENKQYAAVSI